jgi:flagellar biosynthetic protein FlhB
MSDSELNKSEDASPYKLEQARKKGVVARSPELGLVVALACCAAYLWARGTELGAHVSQLAARTFAGAGALDGGGGAMLAWTGALFSEAFSALLPLIAIVVLGTLVASIAQVGLLFAPAALKADFNRLNPATGFKRVFSVQVLIEAGKTIVKVVVYGWLATYVVRGLIVTLSHADTPATRLPGLLLHGTARLLFLLIGAALVFAAVDQLIVRRMFARKMRMSKHEVKQEYRQREGDPRIKRRRKQLQRELLKRSKSMRGIRGADLVVANPTHVVVALRYEPGRMAAPMVVAKGAGEFALRLRKLAFIYGIPVLESKAFARQLFRGTELGSEIPAELYRTAASLYMHMRQRAAKAAA